MNEQEGRRPLKVRNQATVQRVARWLNNRQITPNQISLLSLLFAGLSALCLVLLGQRSSSLTWALPILAALFIQCRLLCNLFDGLVAVEGGKGTPSGELFNDIPDRCADAAIFIAAGYAIGIFDWASELGWLAALLAVMTAYLRTLATSIGAPNKFLGPMAKQHRMALMTIACLLAATEPLFWPQGYSLLIAIIVVIVGCFITLWRRARAAYVALEHKDRV